MWMVGDGVDGKEKLLNATTAILYTLVYFTQIPEWWVPAKVTDLLDFSIRKITSVAVFLITFFFSLQLFNICYPTPPTKPSMENHRAQVAGWGKRLHLDVSGLPDQQ